MKTILMGIWLWALVASVFLYVTWCLYLIKKVRRRQNADRRWQTCFPMDEKNERRVVLEFNEDKEIRTYIERRKS